jgi:predicted NBD/HSP70 family sugar kinase
MDEMTEHFALGFNARRLLAVLRAQGPQSRADLARSLDVTPSTVTRLAGALIDTGLLNEGRDPNREGQKGFPAKLLRIAPDGLCTAGVYIDPDRIMTCLSDLTGTVLSHETISVTDRSFDALMRRAAASIQGMERAVAPGRVAGCGVSYPGQYGQDPTRVSRIRQFSNWPSVNVERDLSPYFGMPVRHLNDGKAACLSELYYGACKDVQNFCHIWLSYGIGGAAVVDGRLNLGLNNGAAEWGGLFPKSQPRPSGQDLLDTLAATGMPLERLSDIDDSHLAMPTVIAWRNRATEQLRWLCLVIARTLAPDAIVLGGTLHPSLIDSFVASIAEAPTLGEDYTTTAPRLLRAARDALPQRGAASLPVHALLNPAIHKGQARKGW